MFGSVAGTWNKPNTYQQLSPKGITVRPINSKIRTTTHSGITVAWCLDTYPWSPAYMYVRSSPVIILVVIQNLQPDCFSVGYSWQIMNFKIILTWVKWHPTTLVLRITLFFPTSELMAIWEWYWAIFGIVDWETFLILGIQGYKNFILYWLLLQTGLVLILACRISGFEFKVFSH